MISEDFEAEYDEAQGVLGEEPPDYTPEDLEGAERSLRAVRYFRGQLQAREAHRDAEIQRVERWFAEEARRLEKRLKWHEVALRLFLEQTGEKTKKLVNGTIRRRKGRERVDVTLPETFIDWAKKAGHDDLIRVTESPDKKAVAKYVKETGEEPPGVELNRGEDSYSIEV